jgi:hypothetical protein
LQTHLPALQAWPVAQGAQVAPPVPHVPMLSALCRTQVVPLQQPPLQELELQTHCPLLPQAWPVAQATQAAPPLPQVVAPEVWHWPFLSQQPLGHDAASQTHCPWALHSCWLPQVTQEPPLAPQAFFEAVTQAPFEQQPPQLAPPQLQAPPLQACPEAQLPQAAPSEPQALVLCPAVRMHFPVASQQPPEQEAGVQPQTPAALQAWPLAQGAQVAPPVPQLGVDWLDWLA